MERELVEREREGGRGLHEPYDDGDVVGDAVEGDGDSAVGLEEVDGAAVVVGEGGGLGLEGGEGGGEGDEVLADKPFGVLGVGEGGGAALGEDGAQELLGQLGVGRRWACRLYHLGGWCLGREKMNGKIV